MFWFFIILSILFFISGIASFAPEGYEDEHGFHYGRKDDKKNTNEKEDQDED